MKKIIFSFVFLFVLSLVQAQCALLVLDDTSDQFVWKDNFHQIYIEENKTSDLNQIKELYKKGYFKEPEQETPRIKNPNHNLWAYIHIANKSRINENWLIELYDFHIDEYDIYVLHKDSLQNHFTGGDKDPFNDRKIKHKNYIHPIVFAKGQEYDIYIRIKSKQSVAIIGVIRTFDNLLAYSNQEYFLLSIFYGLMGIMGIYSFLIFLYLREKVYIYFSFYIASTIFYSLSNDGFGYQYLWSNYPLFNDHTQSLAVYLFIVSSLLYSGEFLHLKTLLPLFCKVIQILVILRTLLFIGGILFLPRLTYYYQIDVVILIFLFFMGIYSYSKGYKAARFFILAYSSLFIGFSINMMMILGFAKNDYITVYGLNYGAVLQMVFLSLAVAERIRIINKEREEAQQEIIVQLKEKETLKDKLTRELEEKVKERTKELEYKNQQLDAFVYKASHDIKGPLRSILGLAKLGVIDIKEPLAQEYFKHIEKSSLRLDGLLNDLLQIAKIKDKQISATLIDFKKIFDDVKESLINIPSFKDFQIDVTIKQDRNFYSDEKMIYSIFQNLIENAFKYRDTTKENSILTVRIEVDKQKSVIEFADNGLGINKDLKDKIFDMFFRASELSGGTGLGLYLVKMAVEKIGGRINVETELNKGSIFTIVI